MGWPNVAIDCEFSRARALRGTARLAEIMAKPRTITLSICGVSASGDKRSKKYWHGSTEAAALGLKFVVC